MQNVQQLRKSYLTLPLPGNPVAATKVATFIAGHPARLTAAQLAVSDSGVGTGATTITVKVNGVAVVTGISVAVGAATLGTKAAVKGAITSVPDGYRLNNGDVVTVDITAVPGTTPPKAASVILSILELDI